jgi:hypothetical protein
VSQQGRHLEVEKPPEFRLFIDLGRSRWSGGEGNLTRKRSSGLCRLFRTRAIGRVAVQLCLFLLMANLIAPLAWATAHGGASSDGFAICHTATDEADSGRAQPADHQHDQMVPQCPLRLVFSGSIRVPPSSAPEILRAARFRAHDEPPVGDDSQPRRQTLRLRPNPWAPPASA